MHNILAKILSAPVVKTRRWEDRISPGQHIMRRYLTKICRLIVAVNIIIQGDISLFNDLAFKFHGRGKMALINRPNVRG